MTGRVDIKKKTSQNLSWDAPGKRKPRPQLVKKDRHLSSG